MPNCWGDRELLRRAYLGVVEREELRLESATVISAMAVEVGEAKVRKDSLEG